MRLTELCRKSGFYCVKIQCHQCDNIREDFEWPDEDFLQVIVGLLGCWGGQVQSGSVVNQWCVQCNPQPQIPSFLPQANCVLGETNWAVIVTMREENVRGKNENVGLAINFFVLEIFYTVEVFLKIQLESELTNRVAQKNDVRFRQRGVFSSGLKHFEWSSQRLTESFLQNSSSNEQSKPIPHFVWSISLCDDIKKEVPLIHSADLFEKNLGGSCLWQNGGWSAFSITLFLPLYLIVIAIGRWHGRYTCALCGPIPLADYIPGSMAWMGRDMLEACSKLWIL